MDYAKITDDHLLVIVAKCLGWTDIHWGYEGNEKPVGYHPKNKTLEDKPIPDYVGSVDAALKLPLPGWLTWHLVYDPESGAGRAHLEITIMRHHYPDAPPRGTFKEPEVDAASLPRAMCEAWMELQDSRAADNDRRAGQEGE